MSSDIPGARAILQAVLRGHLSWQEGIDLALAKMTRTQQKKAVYRGRRVNPANRAHCETVLQSTRADSMTDTEIAQEVFGHSCAAGRVSEIRAEMIARGYTQGQL